MKASFDTLYQHARTSFTARYGMQEASAMAFALLEDLYGTSRTDVLLGKDKEFSAEEHHDFGEIVKKIADGTPMQYATGRALFCGRYFMVTPAVLIPRPETEALIPQHVRALPLARRPVRATLARARTGELRVLDLGTGTGCIAISIALDHPDCKVEGWDVSAAALRVAEENARRLGATNVEFRERDILAEAAACRDGKAAEAQACLIVSNPPYICRREAAEMEEHVVDHEPATALFVPDDDPLLFYRAIAEIGLAYLCPGGEVCVECNREYTQQTAELFSAYGYERVEVTDDCFGVPRFVKACSKD